MSLTKTLENYGLNEKEAKVYLASLELGGASVQKISRKTDFPRSTCYDILDSLRKKGLISTFRKKQIRYFSPEDPQSLINNAKENLELLEESLPQFRAVYGRSKDRPTVRFYQGKEQMKMILDEILKEAKELIAFGSPTDIFITLGKIFPKFVAKRVKRKIPVRTIVPDSPTSRERKRLGPAHLREVRLTSTKYNHHTLTFVWDKKIAMFSLKKELVALVIESEELAQSQIAMFNFMWETGEFVE